MNKCERCLVPPNPITEVGTLCIALPIAHSLVAIRDLLRQEELAHDEPGPNMVTIPLTPGVLPRLDRGLRAVMTAVELRETKALILGDDQTLSLADLASVQSLATLFAKIRGEWFAEILRDNRLTCHFQPIVHTSDRRQVFAYECLLRGLNPRGQLISPDRLYEAAREADLIFPLDRAARLTAIREAVSHGLDAGTHHLFINFNPTSIYNPVFCLKSTVAAIANSQLRPDRIVFEIVESDQVGDVGHLVRIADFYRQAGFKVALDDLGSGYGSLNLLSRIRPDFVKLDMHLIRGVDHDPYKASIAAKLLELAQDVGVATVAEGIETEAEYRWFLDHGANYVQGFLLGRPASPPPRSGNT